jgi:PAS domain-containing protein
LKICSIMLPELVSYVDETSHVCKFGNKAYAKIFQHRSRIRWLASTQGMSLVVRLSKRLPLDIKPRCQVRNRSMNHHFYYRMVILITFMRITSHTKKKVRQQGFLAVVQDITDRKKAEDELRISEQKFRNLAENVPGLVLKYRLNPDGSDELLYISKSVEDIFEVSQEDAFKNNKLLWDRIHGDDLEEYLESIKTSAENLSLWEQEHRIQLPDGTVKWLYTRGCSRPTGRRQCCLGYRGAGYH